MVSCKTSAHAIVDLRVFGAHCASRAWSRPGGVRSDSNDVSNKNQYSAHVIAAAVAVADVAAVVVVVKTTNATAAAMTCAEY